MPEGLFLLWIMWETITIAIKAATVALVGVLMLLIVFALLHSLWSDLDVESTNKQ